MIRSFYRQWPKFSCFFQNGNTFFRPQENKNEAIPFFCDLRERQRCFGRFWAGETVYTCLLLVFGYIGISWWIVYWDLFWGFHKEGIMTCISFVYWHVSCACLTRQNPWSARLVWWGMDRSYFLDLQQAEHSWAHSMRVIHWVIQSATSDHMRSWGLCLDQFLHWLLDFWGISRNQWHQTKPSQNIPKPWAKAISSSPKTCLYHVIPVFFNVF